MSEPASQNDRAPRPAPKWLGALPIVALALVVTSFFAPFVAFVAAPIVVLMMVTHVIGLLNTAGSVVPFVVLVGIDMLMLVIVVGLLIHR